MINYTYTYPCIWIIKHWDFVNMHSTLIVTLLLIFKT